MAYTEAHISIYQFYMYKATRITAKGWVVQILYSVFVISQAIMQRSYKGLFRNKMVNVVTSHSHRLFSIQKRTFRQHSKTPSIQWDSLTTESVWTGFAQVLLKLQVPSQYHTWRMYALRLRVQLACDVNLGNEMNIIRSFSNFWRKFRGFEKTSRLHIYILARYNGRVRR